MTSMGKMEKAKLQQPPIPFDEKWTSKKPQKAKLVMLLKRNAKTKAQYLLSRRIASAVFPSLTRASLIPWASGTHVWAGPLSYQLPRGQLFCELYSLHRSSWASGCKYKHRMLIFEWRQWGKWRKLNFSNRINHSRKNGHARSCKKQNWSFC